MIPPEFGVGRLWQCVRALGFRDGWRYWVIQNRMARDPRLMIEWAKFCQQKARELDKKNPQVAWCYRDWARTLVIYYHTNVKEEGVV